MVTEALGRMKSLLPIVSGLLFAVLVHQYREISLVANFLPVVDWAATTVASAPGWIQDSTEAISSSFVRSLTGDPAYTSSENDDGTILEYLPWELRSFQRGPDSCRPPPGSPSYCCVGSTHLSREGGLSSSSQSFCNLQPNVFHDLAAYTQEFLALLPKPANPNNSTTRCDACALVDHLIDQGWSLGLQGDSQTAASYYALECELRRRGYQITSSESQELQPPAADWKHGSLRLQASFRVTRPNQQVSLQSPAAKISLFYMKRPSLGEPANLMELAKIASQVDVLMLAHGLQFRSNPYVRHEFQTAMTQLLAAYKKPKKPHSLKLLLWRETMVTHYNRSEGHWDRKPYSKRCSSLSANNDRQGYHVRHVRHAALQNRWAFVNALDPGFASLVPTDALSLHHSELVYIPFRKFLEPLHYLHGTSHEQQEDCTHYCYSPYLWLPLWRGLRLALDRTVALSKPGAKLPPFPYQLYDQDRFRPSAALDFSPVKRRTEMIIKGFANWELQGLVKNDTVRECRPPLGIPQHCCAGVMNHNGAAAHRFVSSKCRLRRDKEYRDYEKYTWHFMRDMPQPTLNPDQGCDVCQIVELLFEKKWRLGFQGDSMTGGSFASLECELYRRGYTLTTSQPILTARAPNAFWKYGLHHRTVMTITRAAKQGEYESVEIVLFFLYRPNTDDPDGLTEVQQIAQEVDILVFDHGLHYRHEKRARPEFAQSMSKLLGAYQSANSSRVQLLLWRETTTSHYNQLDGHHGQGLNCAPLKGDQEGFYKQVLSEAAAANGMAFTNALELPAAPQAAGLNELIFLPYRQFLNPLHYLHENGGDRDPPDCTHYCLVPNLWLPVWRGLRLAVDRFSKQRPPPRRRPRLISSPHQQEPSLEVPATTTTANDTPTNATPAITNQSTPSPPTPTMAAPAQATSNVSNSNASSRPLEAPRAQQEVFVPFLRWERRSIDKRECEPPKGIPKYCCAGVSNVGGGSRNVFSSQVCDLKRFDELQQFMMNNVVSQLPSPMTGGHGQACDACQIVEYLIQKKWTLGLQGDSVMAQSFLGLECELRRRGYRVTKKYEKVEQQEEVFWRQGLRERQILTIRQPGDTKYSMATARIVLFFMYRPLANAASRTRELNEIANQVDVLVFDHGLHYDPQTKESRAEFGDDMKAMLQVYHPRLSSRKSNSSLQLLIWRETTPSHYNQTGGYYGQGLTCGPFRPLNSAGGPLGFYVAVMQRAATFHKLKLVNALDSSNDGSNLALPYIPVRDYMTPLHYLHDGNLTNGTDDCTHYCLVPNLWFPIWRGLRLALDRQFAAGGRSPRLPAKKPGTSKAGAKGEKAKTKTKKTIAMESA